eukprot:c12545_g1_i1.p1 GENE.c12545_g1_i1~~c12545_g1_i1.p1  ORF type:complete len:102 (+),score=16.49 c12545_g1_i1:394-699(+)
MSVVCVNVFVVCACLCFLPVPVPGCICHSSSHALSLSPHKPADLPLKFVSRRSSRVRFKIVMPSGVPQTVVTVAFHPSLPIAITYSKSPFVGATAILHVHA